MANKYAGPVQGKVRLVMDAPEGDGAEVKLARVMLDCAEFKPRAARVVEAKPGHMVIALPLEGSESAGELVEACAEAAFYALPGRPPIPWQKFRVADLAGTFGIRKAVLAVLTAAGAFVDKWGSKEGSVA